MQTTIIPKGTRGIKFNPTREEIKIAVEEFIKNGGTIKKIVLSDDEWNVYVAGIAEADFYLRENSGGKNIKWGTNASK